MEHPVRRASQLSPKPLLQPSRSQALVRGTTWWLAVLAPDSVSCPSLSLGNRMSVEHLSTSVLGPCPPIPASLSPALNLFSFFSHLCQCFQISLVRYLPTSESFPSKLHVSCPPVFLASYLSISPSAGVLYGGTSPSPPPAVRPWGAGDSGSVISEDLGLPG